VPPVPPPPPPNPLRSARKSRKDTGIPAVISAASTTAAAIELPTTDGGQPYSPSTAVERMEVDDPLEGVKRLMQEPPPSTLYEEGVPATVPPGTGPSDRPGGDTPEQQAATVASETDILARSKAYVKKATVDNIEAKLGRDNLAYQTIQAHNII
jgi:hypothetical protein